MVVKRKAIFKKAIARNAQAKKYDNAKRRLTDAFRGIPKRPGGDGMIHLDPREWGGNGGFNQPQPPVQQLEAMYKQAEMQKNLQNMMKQRQFEQALQGPENGIQLDPREWGGNGGFQEGLQKDFESISNQFGEQRRSQNFNFAKDNLKRSLQSFRGQPPTAGGGGVGSGDGNTTPAPMPGVPSIGTPAPTPGVRPPGSGGGMIHLDPREWGGNGGFGGGQKQIPSPMPSVPRPPMSGGQKPMPMPQLPNPNPMKQMPMANPRRNLIPRPIDPRYKMM